MAHREPGYVLSGVVFAAITSILVGYPIACGFSSSSEIFGVTVQRWLLISLALIAATSIYIARIRSGLLLRYNFVVLPAFFTALSLAMIRINPAVGEEWRLGVLLLASFTLGAPFLPSLVALGFHTKHCMNIKANK